MISRPQWLIRNDLVADLAWAVASVSVFAAHSWSGSWLVSGC